MTLHVQDGGIWKPVTDLYVKQAGVWVPVQTASTRVAGVWTQYFQAEIVVTITAANGVQQGLLISNLFSSADWTSTKNKRVVFASDALVIGTDWGALAMQGGSLGDATWGGRLTVDNYGIIQGRGGIPNAGVGGKAIYDEDNNPDFTKKAIFNNYGTIRAGGGAGGKGGQGGTGYYESTVQEGPVYNVSTHRWWKPSGQSGGARIRWGSSSPLFSGFPVDGPIAHGGYTYYPGAYRAAGGEPTAGGGTGSIHEVYRTYIQGTNVGGAEGGNGGRGQGSDGNNTGGNGSNNNGGNSGWSGVGGTGGTWGQPGGRGADGQGGNAGGGGAGQEGGAAGVAYRAGVVTMNNYGTIQGRVR